MPKTIPQPLKNEVGARAWNAAKWVVGLLVARQLMTFGTTMITSRLVSPADFGIAGMVATFVAFMVLFDTGLVWATVQPKELYQRQVNSMFWAGSMIGLVLFGICIAAGPLLADYYRTPELVGVSGAMGLTVLFNSITTQPSALLRRSLRQKQNNLIDASALVLSSLVAMGLAFWLRNYWAIVLQAVVFQGLRLVFLLTISGFRVARPVFDRSAIPLMRKGSGFAASNYITYVQLYLPTILIGHLFGSQALGLYTKASALKAMPTAYAAIVVTDVMVSSMSVFHGDAQKVGEIYRKALGVVAFIACPAGAMLLPLAPEAIRLLYGVQWPAAVPLLQLMAFPAMLLPISTSVIWLFLSSGSARKQIIMNVWLTSLTILVFWLVYRMLNDVREMVMIEALLASILYPAVGLVVSHRAVGISLLKTVKQVAPILLVSVVTASIVLGLFQQITLDWKWALVAKASVGSLVYITLAIIFIRPFPVEILGKYLLKRKSVSKDGIT